MNGIHITVPFDLFILLDEKSSLVDLERGAIDNLPTKKRQYATDPIQLTGLKITPFIGTKALLFRGDAVSDGKNYTPIIMFNNVQFEEEDTPTNLTFMASDNEEYNIQVIPAKENFCQVRCNCMDFYYRFALWNFNDGSLYGRKPKPYQKTTDRPPVNPKKSPGLCKHLMKMGQLLYQTKMIKL